MKHNLECIDTYFYVENKDTKIKESEIEKVNRAWAEGHSVILIIYQTFSGSKFLEIRTVNNIKQVGQYNMNITSRWKYYAQMLTKNQFPIEWEHLF